MNEDASIEIKLTVFDDLATLSNEVFWDCFLIKYVDSCWLLFFSFDVGWWCCSTTDLFDFPVAVFVITVVLDGDVVGNDSVELVAASAVVSSLWSDDVGAFWNTIAKPLGDGDSSAPWTARQRRKIVKLIICLKILIVFTY